MLQSHVTEKIRGIVERITYHNADTGWSVLKVKLFDSFGEETTVTVHQMRVFAGATMEFSGNWTTHARFGRQFKAHTANELKPASAGALEKYLGSGLIKGVGPKTARKIVRHFGKETLDIFSNNIERLTEVPGIAQKKLAAITTAWQEHQALRDVMIFLQSHGISTLFAVRIFKQYGDDAIALVSENPYRLASDFYGIGFFTADRVGLSIGFPEDSPVRITAGIRHVLAASREQGHCYLTLEQIVSGVTDLLSQHVESKIPGFLQQMEQDGDFRVRTLVGKDGKALRCYYAKSLYYDEKYVAERLAAMVRPLSLDVERAKQWLARYSTRIKLELSEEQARAVLSIAGCQCAVLTGGPGCGKTTTTKTLVALFQAVGRSVLLAAPTGRAAQRMGEVIGMEAKTIHRLLEFQGTGFKRNEENPLKCDVLILDECSMLDITLTATLLRAVASDTAVVFIGDADQLPSVGAGNVLCDMIASGSIPCSTLTTIYRQASESKIITYAHQINQGEVPRIDSPFKNPEVWKAVDCFFVDSEQATQAQLRFIRRVKEKFRTIEQREESGVDVARFYETESVENGRTCTYRDMEIPEQFSHVNLQNLVTAEKGAGELSAVLKKIHPWSSLFYGLTAEDVVRRLYTEWIPKYYGIDCEIQVLCPMIRGSMGTAALNTMLQAAVNPRRPGRAEIIVGERVFRVGDRVIHRRNNYDLGVFNGDIGQITAVENNALTLVVRFFQDGREVEYQREQITELESAYAITIHKSQGSEFEVIIIPVLTQHYRMLFRNLLYTGITRARKLAVFVGTRRALAMGIATQDSGRRQTALCQLLETSRAIS